MAELLNNTSHGFSCHFLFLYEKNNDCGGVYIYGWLFFITYLIYSVSSIKFLIMSQSAVFTVAVTTTALPLTGIWWSLFHMTSVDKGIIIYCFFFKALIKILFCRFIIMVTVYNWRIDMFIIGPSYCSSRSRVIV